MFFDREHFNVGVIINTTIVKRNNMMSMKH